MSWWSRHYGRPLKDPILLSYSLEELAYEYYSVQEREVARDEFVQSESDKIEEAKLEDADKWADEMEKEEMERAVKAPPNPAQDPANLAWMEEEIKKDKELFGENFGEDLNLDFEGK
jgi:hypothetical protein